MSSIAQEMLLLGFHDEARFILTNKLEETSLVAEKEALSFFYRASNLGMHDFVYQSLEGYKPQCLFYYDIEVNEAVDLLQLTLQELDQNIDDYRANMLDDSSDTAETLEANRKALAQLLLHKLLRQNTGEVLVEALLNRIMAVV